MLCLLQQYSYLCICVRESYPDVGIVMAIYNLRHPVYRKAGHLKQV